VGRSSCCSCCNIMSRSHPRRELLAVGDDRTWH
jgi:hypothetical protein